MVDRLVSNLRGVALDRQRWALNILAFLIGLAIGAHLWEVVISVMLV